MRAVPRSNFSMPQIRSVLAAVFMGVTAMSSLGNAGAARVGQSEHFGDFIEGFADGIVYINSGYNQFGGMPGNVLLAFSVNGQ